MSKMIMVSSCLAGIRCRYDGKDNKVDDIVKMVEQGIAIPVCPEVIGGMSIPRKSCEIVNIDGNRRVQTEEGEDCTKEFMVGALRVLRIAKILDIEIVIFQQRSPSCGFGEIYDGCFRRKLVRGNGITADILSKNGIKIYNGENYMEMLE